ncbi:MAG: magnesium transporter CorA family protein [Bacillota bacterium]|nr:magnesium transporter CorA family protein [Bacillota bacterium]
MLVFDIKDGFKEVAKEDRGLNKNNLWFLINDKGIEAVKGIVSLDEQFVKECMEVKQSSKIGFFDKYIYMHFSVLDYKDERIKAKDLNIFLSKDYIITVFDGELDLIDELERDIKNSKNCFLLKDNPQAFIVLYYILDRMIVRNYRIISELEAKTDAIEIKILKSPRQEQIDQLINLRRQVYIIKKHINPLRYIGDSLISNDNSVIEKDSLHYFTSLNSKIDKLMLYLESLVQDLALVREAFESETGNKTNELMKVFTMIATIFLPLNLITSMYGMNVKHIPFTRMDYGYYIVVFIMVVVAMYLIYLFKKKKWL